LLLTILCSWPIVVGCIIVAFGVAFRREISAYFRFAKLKYGDLEVSPYQAPASVAVMSAVAIGAENTAALRGEHPQVTDGEQREPHEEVTKRDAGAVVQTWLGSELDRREKEALSWKYLFLDRFLVDSARSALAWLLNFKTVPRSFFDEKWSRLIPAEDQRRRILRVLVELALVRESGDTIAASEEGEGYIEHIYSSAAVEGKPNELRHPFVSIDDMRQYGRWPVTEVAMANGDEPACLHGYRPAFHTPPTP
ncbi:MAG TPA: hypothetical protein VEZ11_08445, partial [Thermoanaerobaculia bacterium]|nr:hypothetical protein [Thermoanaerobaculia bacterium]